MDPAVPVDRDRALRQWETLRGIYLDLGHRVDELPPLPGLPDMVYAANGATGAGRHGARRPVPAPRAPGRGGRAPGLVPRGRLRAGWSEPRFVNEGEGDLLVAGPPGDQVAAGRHRLPHRPAGARRGGRRAGLPGAAAGAGRPALLPPGHRAGRARRATPSPGCRRRSRPHSRELLAARFPDAVVADPEDAAVLGLNAVSDGRHVVLAGAGPAAGRDDRRTRLRADPGRPVRAAQGRRRSEVLHVGGTGMTIVSETATDWHQRLVAEHSAHNYHPLPVVVAHAEGAWVTDVEGRRYLDCLAGYSALNFGHGHPALLAAAHRQLDRVTLTSRAFGNDQLGPFCAELVGAARQAAGAADEHRRRGGRVRDQGGPQVGLRGQGRRPGPGPDRRRGRRLPRPHDDDRRLLHRPGGARRLRAVRAGVRRGPLRRRRRAAGGGHARRPWRCWSSRSRARPG